MEDLITGVNSAGFRLRKWASNSSEVLASIPVELHNDSEVLNEALGLKWRPATDQLCFDVLCWGAEMPITNRILWESSKEEIRDVNASSKLRTLCPILQDGLLRVGGRLRNAPISFDRKHPIILPALHPLTLMIVRHYHNSLFHAGQQMMITMICERYWPLRIPTHFRGADRVLKELQQLFETQQLQYVVTSYCAPEGINFQFIPPRSPHFGGLWEAA
uniref:Integrase zinc-binding domain-containing protein n=1 Tax=Anopheles funestus TaxID=62324 RepID=A0A182RY90_ANOFN